MEPKRKQSSGDLHSRLKTRKLLGVGGTDNGGDIYRSKLSQILGHGDRLQRRLPRGVREWQLACAVGFTCFALLTLIKPSILMPADEAVSSSSGIQSLTICRLYGGCMLVLACGLWLSWRSADFDLVRCSLVGTAALLTVHLAVLIGDQQASRAGQAGLLAVAIVSAWMSARLFQLQPLLSLWT